MKNTEPQNSFIHFRFALIFVLSLLVMTLDVRSKLLSDFRYYVESALYPILVFADSPHSVSKIVSTQFKSHSQLIAENEKLATENFMQRADILLLNDLEEENAVLRKLLNTPVRKSATRLFAEVIDVDPDPYLSRVMVNRGTSVGVYEGMPVITDLGLVGQVIEANYSFSRVLLLTDPNCQIPVIDERSQVRAICAGVGSHSDIQIINVPRSADVKEGDMLLTSGIGGVYPRGYPVAIVTSVGTSESQPFAAIRAKPVVQTDKMLYVLMFTNDTDMVDNTSISTDYKQLSDNKFILHQQKVKQLMKTMSESRKFEHNSLEDSPPEQPSGNAGQ